MPIDPTGLGDRVHNDTADPALDFTALKDKVDNEIIPLVNQLYAGTVNVDAICRYQTGAWPLRVTVTTEPDRRVVWVGPSPGPPFGGGWAVNGDILQVQ